MIRNIKNALRLRKARKEIHLLDTAAECLNKIRTSVPDEVISGECSGTGGLAIKEHLAKTALLIDENLRSLLESYPFPQSNESKTEGGPVVAKEVALNDQNTLATIQRSPLQFSK